MTTQLSGIEGFKEAASILRQLPLNIENRALQATTAAGARAVAKQIKAAAPRSTTDRSPASKKFGQLFRNIKVAPFRAARREKGKRGSVVSTKNAFWAYFYEFGTSRQPPRPFFRQAFNAAAPQAIVAMREALGRAVEREAAKLAAKVRK